MLKIEKLQPKDNVFTLADGADHGDALLKVKNEAFTGEYHMHEAGTATVAAISCAAKCDEAISGITLDDAPTTNINVKLTKKVVRNFAVEAGQTTIQVPDLSLTDATKIAGDSTSAATVSSTAEHAITIADATKGNLALELTVLVATGVAADDNIAAAQTLTLDAGTNPTAQDVHFDMLCNVRINPACKPNLSSFTVTGAKLHF